LIVIYCEGQNTEPSYIKKFSADVGTALIEVELIGGAGALTTIVSKSLGRRKALLTAAQKASANSFESRFEVWAVFDADNNSSGAIKDARNRLRDGGVGVAFSNPCFEIWILMHYQEVDGPLTHHKAQGLLSKCMPSYNHGRGAEIDYEKIREFYFDALKRARAAERRRLEERLPEGNPYTGVFKLTESIKAAAGAIPFGNSKHSTPS
jgi:hypothetical protein